MFKLSFGWSVILLTTTIGAVAGVWAHQYSHDYYLDFGIVDLREFLAIGAIVGLCAGFIVAKIKRALGRDRDPKKWPQIGLRSFMLAVALVAVACASFAHFVIRANAQRNAVDYVIRNGGTVAYERNTNSIGRLLPATPKYIPNAIVRLMGIDFFVNVKQANINTSDFSDLTPLAGLTQLDSLYLQRTNVSDISTLSKLVNLRHLCLGGTKVSDITPLKNLRKLSDLQLSNTNVSDVSPLAGLPSLRKLDLCNTSVTNLAPMVVEKLSDQVPLRELHIGNIEATEIAALRKLIDLKRLALYGVAFNKKELDELQEHLPDLLVQRHDLYKY